MDIKLTFHGMPHSDVIEQHIKEKLQKLAKHLKAFEDQSPFFAEFWVKNEPQHAHHGAELHLKTPQFDLHTHEENPELYVAVDKVIDTMIILVSKEREKRRDSQRRGIDKEHRLDGLLPDEESEE